MQVVRPRTVSVAQTTVTVRNPVAVWILGFMTLGIYTVVWTYQVPRRGMALLGTLASGRAQALAEQTRQDAIRTNISSR